METYTEYCKNFIIDRIYDYEGIAVYMCDLGYTLTEGINVNGSATYSTHEAKEYIKAWFDEAGEVYEYQKANYGECLQNPFENPEAFHVVMVIEGVNNLLSRCKTVSALWDSQEELTSELIKQILTEVEKIEKIEF